MAVALKGLDLDMESDAANKHRLATLSLSQFLQHSQKYRHLNRSEVDIGVHRLDGRSNHHTISQIYATESRELL